MKDDVAGLVERFDDAYCVLMAMKIDHPEKSWPTSFVYPDEVRNAAEAMRDALTTLSAENERLESHIKKLEEANKQLRMALGDLLSWFPDKPTKPHWQIEAGEQGADDAITYARELFEKGAAKNDAA